MRKPDYLNKTLIILVCIFHQLICSSQIRIKVVNNENLGIPFATVAWNKTSGLVTLEDGTVTIPNMNNIDDSILVTSIGYQDRIIYKKNINPDAVNVIHMDPLIISLPAVVVGSKFKIYQTGYIGKKPKCYIVNLLENRAFETGVKIEGYKTASFLEEIHIYIDPSSTGNIPFRLKIYNVENGLPGKNILNDNLIIKNYTPGLWEKFSLNHLNIQLPAIGFFVGIEWLITQKDKGKLAIGADNWTSNEHRYIKMGNTGFLKLPGEKLNKKNKCIPAIKIITANKD